MEIGVLYKNVISNQFLKLNNAANAMTQKLYKDFFYLQKNSIFSPFVRIQMVNPTRLS